MKNIFLLIFIFVFTFQAYGNDSEVFIEKNKFGLKQNGIVIVEPKYTKLIKLKDVSYLSLYKNKYGIISKDGTILIDNTYTSAQRYLGKYVKLGKNGKYAIFDETGDMIVLPEYTSIDILFGRMFLVKKNYKYGLISFDGDILLAPIADDIYMPEPNTLRIKYEGNWYEIKRTTNETLNLSNSFVFNNNDKFTITKIVENPITSAGYGIVSTSDYTMKIISSISPAYENTIDELVLSHGADTVSILMKSSWLVRFPYTYAKNYINLFKTPNNGPLSEIKVNLKNKINN